MNAIKDYLQTRTPENPQDTFTRSVSLFSTPTHRGRDNHSRKDIAPLISFSAAEVRLLADLDLEVCEAKFLSIIDRRFGGPVDWRGSPDDIYEVVLLCLTADERRRLFRIRSF